MFSSSSSVDLFVYCPLVSRYSEEFEDVFGSLAYATQNKVYSDLNLELSARAISLNTASYSAWYFRRKCLIFLNRPLDLELVYTLETGTQNPKNYQVGPLQFNS